MFVRRLVSLWVGAPGLALLLLCSGFFTLNTKAMKRRKFTVRFSDEEFQALVAFADREHVIPSAAVRWLLEWPWPTRTPKPAET
jgi:hypothetical protein